MSKVKFHLSIVVVLSTLNINCSPKENDLDNEKGLKKDTTVVASKINPDTSLNNFYSILASDSTLVNWNAET